MNINAKINWQSGMELTPQTFVSWDSILRTYQHQSVLAAWGHRVAGLLPEATFNNNGTFVRGNFRIDRFQCIALLPSGQLLQADEEVSVKVPMLYGHYYYLTVALAPTEIVFEHEGVPMLRPEHVYEIHTFEEVEAMDAIPVARFQVNEGSFSIDADYIPPCLSLESLPILGSYLSTYTEQVEKLATHANLEEGEGKRLMMRYLFLLRSYTKQHTLSEFLLFTQEIAQVIDYYIITPHAERQEIPQPSINDVQLWLTWLKGYLDGAASVLEGVVLEDHTIDFDALKAQIKAELYEQLNPELYRKLIDDLKISLRDELSEHLTETLRTYFDETMKPQLQETLKVELTDTLRDSLYQQLYDALYQALYVPAEEEEDFMPII
jgi:hypothetical protein